MHTIINPDTQLVFRICSCTSEILFSMPKRQVPANHKPACATTPECNRPTSQANASHNMPTARWLLAEAHQAMFAESKQLGRDATAMDMILDHRLLINVAGLPTDGRRRSPAARNTAPRCQADIDAYWAQQEERRKFISPITSNNIEPPVSAERSTMAWPPNFDGDGVWDSAS